MLWYLHCFQVLLYLEGFARGGWINPWVQAALLTLQVLFQVFYFASLLVCRSLLLYLKLEPNNAIITLRRKEIWRFGFVRQMMLNLKWEWKWNYLIGSRGSMNWFTRLASVCKLFIYKEKSFIIYYKLMPITYLQNYILTLLLCSK